MTRDDIIRLGFETNLFIYNGDDTSLTILLIPTEEKLLKFAALVAAAEREACAKVCKDRSTALEKSDDEISTVEFIEASEARRCAAAIRARGE